MKASFKSELPWFEYSSRTPKKPRRRAARKARTNRTFEVRFFCDRLWTPDLGRFVKSFPEYRGKEIVLNSQKATELEPLVYQWLVAAGKI